MKGRGKVNIIKHEGEGELEITPEEIEGTLRAITPEAVRQAGGILSDTVRSWRVMNEMRIVKRVQEYAKKHGIKLGPVALKVLAPLLETASLEEDATLQKMWAALLLNASAKTADVETRYIDMLKQLSAVEVKLLDYFYDKYFESDDNPNDVLAAVTNLPPIHIQDVAIELSRLGYLKLAKNSFIPSDSDLPWVERTFDDIVRLNIWDRRIPSESQHLPNDIDIPLVDIRYGFTWLGFAFVHACKYPENKSPEDHSRKIASRTI